MSRLKSIRLAIQDKLKYLILKIMGIKPESSNGVSVIIRDPNNYEKILVVKHNYAMKKWSLPGGGIHQGEMPHLAAKREALEESNLIITKLRQIGTFTLVKKKEQLFVFEVEEFEGRPFVNGINISDWKFVESGTFNEEDIYRAQESLLMIAKEAHKYRGRQMYGYLSVPPVIFTAD